MSSNSEALKAKGIDAIACVSVNDAFVMGAWGEDQGAGDKVMMLADGNGDFTRALGLEIRRQQIRHGQAQPALFHDRGQWRGEVAQCGSSRARSKSPAPITCWQL